MTRAAPCELQVHTPLPHEPPAPVAVAVAGGRRISWMAPVPVAAAAPTAVPPVKQSYAYERLRRQMLQWDDNFAAAHGRQPTGTDRQASKQYVALKEQYVSLRQVATALVP